jgi:zinc protease
MNIPQSVIQFGHAGFKRHDEDFVPAYVLNYILGGGGFNSRLTEEVREKRGLAYSVYSYLYPLDHAALFLGGAATRNDRVGLSLEIIRAELGRMAKEGPTPEELADAKTYLTGSYALRFDSSLKIAGQLLGIQLQDLGIDYVEKRNGMIEAVTIDDIKRVAARLLKPGELIVTIVGRPEGL